MRVALFGGTFDPPHRGHVALARLAHQRLHLDCILVAPVAMQPLKRETPPASFEDRIAMASIAFAHQPGAEISRIDAPRTDGQSNYTIDALAQLRQSLRLEDQLFCLVGADSFLTLNKWHRPADLLVACDFIVGSRPGFDLSDAASALPAGISAQQQPSQIPHTEILSLHDSSNRTAHLYLLTDLAEDVSATQIRAALAGEASANNVLDPEVLKYIHAHHLYRHL